MTSRLKERVQKEYFNPGVLGIIINPFYIARKGLVSNIEELGKEISGRTLDVGCGTKPYKNYFNSTEYIGLEIETTQHKEAQADVFYKGGSFPFKDKEFDSIVTNQVFEHIFNPDDFMNEINRVLKPGGKLLMTVPFVWDEHEQPFDFARYSSFGLRSVLENHGFEILLLRKSVSDIKVIFQLLNGYIYKKTVHLRILRQIITILVMFPINVLALIISKILPKNEDLYLDNIILSRKSHDV
jgi:SAM-dependent methyltransferase